MILFQIEECKDENACEEIYNLGTDMLEGARFSKVFNMETKAQAVVALRRHYGFYQYLPALSQFIKGWSIISPTVVVITPGMVSPS